MKPHLKHTPIERYDGIWVKREDTYRHPSGAMGSKGRIADAVLRRAKSEGYQTVVLGVARNSSIPAVIARVAAYLGLDCVIHTAASSVAAPDLQLARDAGAAVLEHRPGYQSVINARARADVERLRGFLIPLGLECPEGVVEIAAEVRSTTFPAGVKRLVMPVGSGMMLAGVLTGLMDHPDKPDFPVLGITVGQDPVERLDRFAPKGWRKRVTLKSAGVPFSRYNELPNQLGIPLDPVYENKCVGFCEPQDLFWVVARRMSRW